MASFAVVPPGARAAAEEAVRAMLLPAGTRPSPTGGPPLRWPGSLGPAYPVYRLSVAQLAASPGSISGRSNEYRYRLGTGPTPFAATVIHSDDGATARVRTITRYETDPFPPALAAAVAHERLGTSGEIAELAVAELNWEALLLRTVDSDVVVPYDDTIPGTAYVVNPLASILTALAARARAKLASAPEHADWSS